MRNLTVNNNSATEDLGGGIFNFDGSVSIRNSIISNNLYGGNCSGLITSDGHNLEDTNTCGFTGPGDLINTNPLLGPLQNNGGPTLTHALLPGSPAIDAGDNSVCPTTDQRGVTRPQDGNGDGIAVCDIGAFEFTRATYAISGKVTLGAGLMLRGLAGVTITVSGAAIATATTDSSGNYTFTGLTNGGYTVTPSMAGYAFTPANRSVTISGANVTGQNFTAYRVR